MESAVSLLKAEMGSEVCGTCAPHTFSRLVSTLCLSASVAALDAPPELGAYFLRGKYGASISPSELVESSGPERPGSVHPMWW